MSSVKQPCPICGVPATGHTPIKTEDTRAMVFICPSRKCNYAWTVQGGVFVKDADELKDVFRSTALGRQTLEDVLFGKTLNSATRALMLARLTEYGLQMWMDGLKTGLVNGTRQRENTIPSGE